MTALLAVLAFSMMASATASAFHPLFITESKKELLVLGEAHGLSLLRGEVLGQLGLIGCKLLLFHGWVLHLSPLIHRIKILFEDECRESVPANNTHATCTEPIHVEELLGELGLLTGTNHKVVILLIPVNAKDEFAKVTCGTETTTVTGTIVGEIPENNAKLEKQINVMRPDIETVFTTINKTNQQAITEIFLLGEQMTKDELKTSGFFGGKSSQESPPVSLHAEGGGKVEITTTKE